MKLACKYRLVNESEEEIKKYDIKHLISKIKMKIERNNKK